MGGGASGEFHVGLDYADAGHAGAGFEVLLDFGQVAEAPFAFDKGEVEGVDLARLDIAYVGTAERDKGDVGIQGLDLGGDGV